ncbi:Uncharacterised protein [Vibrio cholerae]|nr:Uncharacterised protein [Vibrio cholerae]CSB42999.1 Uncharacterised protein [Vibrio cholerae]CSB60990.1 Uncharacterised protein [Vibrio cholerae]CSB83699.1 Uncharacterised protein [Vibrio cholerae]CSB84321.1 Uncharacterised protein [Vibrio cholerae]
MDKVKSDTVSFLIFATHSLEKQSLGDVGRDPDAVVRHFNHQLRTVIGQQQGNGFIAVWIF